MADRSAAVADLDIDDVRRGLADGSVLLIDVREPNEFAAGHIPGSVLVPLSSFDPADLPDAGDKRMVFSCRSGKRSLQAVALARDGGVAVDAHYAGGFLDWQAHDAPVATGLDD